MTAAKHQIACYGDAADYEWTCTCGVSFGHSARLAMQHAEKHCDDTERED